MCVKLVEERVPTTGICCDASHLTKTKVTEYRLVYTDTGEEILRERVKYSSVNVGEYLGLVRAIQWVMDNNPEDRIVWSDSQVAITWYNNRESASSKSIPDMRKADLFLQLFDNELKTIKVKHWNKRTIGVENPADFGRK